jgi:hypothetical protein
MEKGVWKDAFFNILFVLTSVIIALFFMH